MVQVGMFEAKTHFSQLIEQLLMGNTDVVQILRRNRPVARITLIQPDTKVRIGSMKGKWRLPTWDEDKAMDRELESAFVESMERPLV